jgi:hypothetical protein
MAEVEASSGISKKVVFWRAEEEPEHEAVKIKPGI